MSPNHSKRSSRSKPPRTRTQVDEILGPEDASLLDIVDNLLNKGVVLNGDLTIGLARVELIYARLSLLLSAADRVLPGEPRGYARHEQERRRDCRLAGTQEEAAEGNSRLTPRLVPA